MKLFSKKFFVILAFSAGFGSYVLAPFKEEPTNRDTEETTNQRDREKQRALAIEKQERAQKEQKRIQDLQTNERLKNANKELKKPVNYD